MINPHKPLTNTLSEKATLFKKSIQSEYYEVINKSNQQDLVFKEVSDTIPHISEIFPTVKRICGDNDERVTADNMKFPYRLICKIIITLQSNQKFRATGFFVSEKCVITAGHCVFPNNDWASFIEVIPGDDKGRKPFGSQKSQKFKCVSGWVQNNDKNYDYGAIILKDNDLHEKIGGYFDSKIYEPIGKEHDNSGYPHDFDSIQKTSRGLTKPYQGNLVQYDIDTYTGNSGSPLFEVQYGNYAAVGVHTYGKCPNHAVRTTKEVIANWNLWIKESQSNV